MAQKQTYTFIIDGAPVVKKNNQKVAFFGKTPTKYNTSVYKDWEKSAFEQLTMQKYLLKINEPIDYAVNLRCRFFMPTRRRVDLSALYEGIQDVLASKDKLDKKTGRVKRYGLYILSDDNFNIVASHDGSGVEIDPARPRMEITITPRESLDV